MWVRHVAGSEGEQRRRARASGRRKMDGLIPSGAICGRDGDLIWVVINYSFICCDERGLGDQSGLAAPAGGWNFQSAMDIISVFIHP